MWIFAVAALAAAWIEMPYHFLLKMNGRVAALAAAWIEIG